LAFFSSLASNLLSKYRQMSLTGTAFESRSYSDLDLICAVWDERLCKLSTLFDEHASDVTSNIMRFCLTGTKSKNSSIWGDLRDCSHSLIRSGRRETFFLYTRELHDGITLSLAKLIFLYLDTDAVNESVDECRRHSVRSVTMPSMSRYLTSSSGVWLRSCPAMVVVQRW